MRKGLYTLIYLLWVSFTFAGNFTAGNVVVVRVGDGSAALSNAATPVFLDEYTSAGSLVQTINLPVSATGANHILTLSGSASSEGSLSLSADSTLLVLAGYDAAVDLSSVASDTSTNRTVASINTNGVVNTATGVIAGSAYKKNNIRGAATQNGSSFYLSGNGSGTTGGIWHVTAGAFTNTPVQISTTITNTRAVNIFDGQLYASASTSSYHGVNAVGTGLPVITGQTITTLPGLPGADTTSSAYGFHFFDLSPSVPGVDVVYIADDRADSLTGGILKYSLVNGTWILNGNISSANSLRGITGAPAGNGVQLFVTGPNGVYTVLDASGYNQPVTGTLNQIATAATNTVIRGIAFAPGVADTSTNSTAINQMAITDNFKTWNSGNNLFVTAQLASQQPCTVKVTGLLGNTIYQSAPINTSQIQLQVASQQFATGCYVVSLVTAQGTASAKVIIAR